jgi:hypothetical protein
MHANGLQLLKRTSGKKESREAWEICTSFGFALRPNAID